MVSDVRFDALGTRWVLELPSTPNMKLQSSITKLVADFQSTYTRFNSDSLLGRLNESKELRNPPKEMFDMLTYAVDMYTQSGGVFNISIGSQLEKDGYGLLPGNKTRVSENLTNDVHITPTRIQIADHVRLDFGGFGKGWLVERVHELLNDHRYPDHIINAGGDIRVGIEPKAVYIESPSAVDQIMGSVMLHNDSLAVSSNSKRKWRTKNGATKTHIVHPSSKAISTSTQMCIRTSTCLLADTVATIMVLHGKDDYHKVAKHFGVEFMALDGTKVVRSSGFEVTLKPEFL